MLEGPAFDDYASGSGHYAEQAPRRLSDDLPTPIGPKLAGLKGHPALAAFRCDAFNVAMSTQPMSREMAAIARAVRIGFWTAVVVGVLWILLDPPAGQDISRWTGGLLVGFLAGIVAMAVALIPSWVRQFLGWSLDE